MKLDVNTITEIVNDEDYPALADKPMNKALFLIIKTCALAVPAVPCRLLERGTHQATIKIDENVYVLNYDTDEQKTVVDYA